MLPEGREAIKIPVYMKGFSLLFPPREVDQFATKVYSIAKKRYGVSEGQYDKIKELEKRGYKIGPEEMPLIKSKKRVDGIEEELYYMRDMSVEEKKKYVASIIE